MKYNIICLRYNHPCLSTHDCHRCLGVFKCRLERHHYWVHGPFGLLFHLGHLSSGIRIPLNGSFSFIIDQSPGQKIQIWQMLWVIETFPSIFFQKRDDWCSPICGRAIIMQYGHAVFLVAFYGFLLAIFCWEIFCNSLRLELLPIGTRSMTIIHRV